MRLFPKGSTVHGAMNYKKMLIIWTTIAKKKRYCRLAVV